MQMYCIAFRMYYCLLAGADLATMTCLRHAKNVYTNYLNILITSLYIAELLIAQRLTHPKRATLIMHILISRFEYECG